MSYSKGLPAISISRGNISSDPKAGKMADGNASYGSTTPTAVAQVLGQATAAISAGASRDAVIKQLRQFGVSDMGGI